jgi:phosphate transport system substrate-binding protein
VTTITWTDNWLAATTGLILISCGGSNEGVRASETVKLQGALVNKKYDKAKLPVMQDLLKYGLTEGQKDAEPLGYIPMPGPVVDRVKAAVDSLSTS